jgi:hypothetical protein
MTKVDCQTKEVYKEILYCPAPPEITRPALPIHNMTPEQEAVDGEVAKNWKATVKILQGYALELETIVETQKEINKAYEEKKLELESSQPKTD